MKRSKLMTSSPNRRVVRIATAALGPGFEDRRDSKTKPPDALLRLRA
jgi:hypothetical protein